MCTKPEQKILPKILIFFQEPGASSSSPPDAEGLIAAREAHTHDQHILIMEKNMGTGLPGSLLLLDEAAGGPIRDSIHTSLFLVVLIVLWP